MGQFGKSVRQLVEGHPWRIALFVGTPSAAALLASGSVGIVPHLAAALVTAVFLVAAIAAWSNLAGGGCRAEQGQRLIAPGTGVGSHGLPALDSG